MPRWLAGLSTQCGNNGRIRNRRALIDAETYLAPDLVIAIPCSMSSPKKGSLLTSQVNPWHDTKRPIRSRDVEGSQSGIWKNRKTLPRGSDRTRCSPKWLSEEPAFLASSWKVRNLKVPPLTFFDFFPKDGRHRYLKKLSEKLSDEEFLVWARANEIALSRWREIFKRRSSNA